MNEGEISAHRGSPRGADRAGEQALRPAMPEDRPFLLTNTLTRQPERLLPI